MTGIEPFFKIQTYPERPIIFEKGDRLIVDTSKPNANLMHDATRPFAVCVKIPIGIGRVRVLARYENLPGAKRALRYLK